MKRFYQNQSGMTLVEIMIAAGLLGGLAIAGASLFKNQDKAQKTVESNYEMATTISQIRGILGDITNCSASLGGLNINGGVVPSTGIKKSGVNVYPTNTNLPGNIKIKSYVLINTVTGLAANETMLRVTFERSKTALKMDVVKSLKVVYTGGPTITSCYAYVNNNDSYWQLASNGTDIYFLNKVGIGTATPSSQLSNNSINMGLLGSGISTTSFNWLMSDGGTGWGATIASTGSSGLALGTELTTGTVLQVSSGAFNSGGVSRPNNLFTVLGTGNVGIGATSPTSKLDVIGTIKTRLQASGNSTGISLIPTTSESPRLEFNVSDGSSRFFFQQLGTNTASERLALYGGPLNATASTEMMTFAGNGNVGIGTSAPGSKLHVVGSATNLQADNASSDPFQLQITGLTNPNQQVLIGYNTTSDYGGIQAIKQTVASMPLVLNRGGGNVGVGRIPTTYKLEVGGDIYANGGWLRTVGSTGWLSETHGGGWYMTDATWIRNYGSKPVNVNAQVLATEFWISSGAGDNKIYQPAANNFGITTSAIERFRIDNNGNVGIGVVPSGTYKLEVSGFIGATAFFYTSDARLKKDIETIQNPLDKITSMRGVGFSWIKDGTKDIGFVAQEVEKVEPRLVLTDKDGMKSVKYGNIIAIVVEAIKELKEMVMNLISGQDELKKQVSELKEENAMLKEHLIRMDSRLERQEQLARAGQVKR